MLIISGSASVSAVNVQNRIQQFTDAQMLFMQQQNSRAQHENMLPEELFSWVCDFLRQACLVETCFSSKSSDFGTETLLWFYGTVVILLFIVTASCGFSTGLLQVPVIPDLFFLSLPFSLDPKLNVFLFSCLTFVPPRSPKTV